MCIVVKRSRSRSMASPKKTTHTVACMLCLFHLAMHPQNQKRAHTSSHEFCPRNDSNTCTTNTEYTTHTNTLQPLSTRIYERHTNMRQSIFSHRIGCSSASSVKVMHLSTCPACAHAICHCVRFPHEHGVALLSPSLSALQYD